MDTINEVSITVNETNLTPNGTEEMPLTVGDNFLTFLDENSSVVFKGVVDSNGTFLIDPSQFVNILLDQSQLQTQSYIDASNPMTIQMIQIPQVFQTTDERSVSADNLQHQLGKLKSSTKSFQTQPCITSLKTQEPVQTTNSEDSALPLIQPSLLSASSSITTELHPPETTNSTVVETASESEKGFRHPTAEASNLTAPLSCNICHEVYPGYQQLKKHKATHVDEKPFRCPQCVMEFNFDMNLKLHLIIHDAEQSGILQCKVCLAKFSRMASLKSHLRTHEREENLVCNECGEEVPTIAKLNDHMEEHNPRVQQCMVYRCKLCGKTFNSQALLRDHSKGHADVRKELKLFARQKPRSRSKSKTKLTSSSSSTSWSSAISKQKKKRICSVCSKAFDKPSQLERHFRVHSGAKPFKCSYPSCNKCFNQKVTLESHVLACHQRLKPFKCHMCNICFSQRGNLKSHIVKVHIPSGENEKVFKCEECACIYRRLATLNHHIARVHSVVTTESETIPSHPQIPDLDEGNSNRKSHNEKLDHPEVDSGVANSVTSEHENQQLRQEASHSEDPTPSTSGPIHPPETTIHEVNCVYGDSLGTPKRCLLKVKKVGQKKYHLCPVCPKSFHKPSDLIRHIRVHTQERPYTCNICAKSFAVKSTLNTHLKTHDLVKRLSCNVCQKKFSVLSSLKSHERLHTGVKPFQCMQCGKQFRTSTQRRVHQKTHTRQALGLTGRRKLLRIGDTKSNVKLSDPLQITSAGLVPVPNKISRTTSDGDPIPEASRPFRCNQANCTSSYKKSSHLKQHMLSHSGERPYKCLQCHRNFISSGVLKNHIKTHEGVRAYRCEQCHFAFTTNGSLKRHMATHVEERLFVCPYCARTFKTSVATRKHIKVHRNEANSGLTDLNDPAKGIMLINQSQPTSTSTTEFPQQFPNMQVCDTSDLNTIYGTEFPEMNHVLTNQINITPCEETEQQGLSQQQQPELAISTDGDVANSSSVPCEEASLILHHSVGDNILEYTLLASTIHSQGDPSENLDLPMDQETNFDSSIFTLQLQHGESLDLQFLQDSQGIGSETGNCLNQIVSYEFESSSAPSQQASTEYVPDLEPNTTAETGGEDDFRISQPPETPSLVSAVSVTKKKSPTAKKEAQDGKTGETTAEVRNLQEVTRPISEQLYTELTTLPYQRRSKGDNGVGSPDESSGNKSCPICKAKFKKKSDLDRHYLIHTGEKPYRCSVCGKSFRVKSTRQAHMRTHDEKKKTVACHVCSNLFSTKSSLRVHLRSHLNLKPYPCPFPSCTRQFRTSGHRKSHIQSHFKQARKHKLETENGFANQPGNLPSVDSIKDNQCTINQQIEELEQRVQAALETPAETINVPENSQIPNGVQLQFDGVHFASLDMSSLQVDDSFLQNVTNVIFLPQGSETEVVDGTNMIIEMLPGQELVQGSTSDILSGRDILAYDVNVLGSTDQVNGTITMPDNIHQYIIHNEMMSSAARPSNSALPNASIGQEYILPTDGIPETTCSVCDKSFSSKALLEKHKKTSHCPASQSLKCTVCSRSFVQKASFEAHLKTHSKAKVELRCPRCPYTTQRKPNLKTHFSRAHPNNWDEFNEVVGNLQTNVTKSALQPV